MKPSFCPMCGAHTKEITIADGSTKQGCDCGYIAYNNPIPVAAVLIPVLVSGTEWGVVMVQRGRPPFPGKWCLPCGFINEHERPRLAAIREAKEETGLDIAPEKILCVCNPAAGEINQITISYMARVTGGVMAAGDDAAGIKIVTATDMLTGKPAEDPDWGISPEVCFRSHRMLLRRFFDGKCGKITGVDLLREGE